MKVLDHGFIELVDIMGDDLEPARAARISYGDTARGWDAGDGKLTKYLLDNEHLTPFEMVEIKWHVKAPIFVARQWVRHRTANWNEISFRYADPAKIAEGEDIEYYSPLKWRGKNPANKQGSVEWSETRAGLDATHQYEYTVDMAISTYYRLVDSGVAREMARMVLPVSLYTEWIWKNDLRNTLHFLRLRMDDHAQWEMRQYANAMHDLLTERLPKLMELATQDRSYGER